MIRETKLMNGQMCIYISGSIYIEEATELRETFTYLINRGHKLFMVDLTQVDYMDSTGLGMLIFVRKQIIQAGGSIKITGLQGLVKDLFELAHLNQQFEIQ